MGPCEYNKASGLCLNGLWRLIWQSVSIKWGLEVAPAQWTLLLYPKGTIISIAAFPQICLAEIVPVRLFFWKLRYNIHIMYSGRCQLNSFRGWLPLAPARWSRPAVRPWTNTLRARTACTMILYSFACQALHKQAAGEGGLHNDHVQLSGLGPTQRGWGRPAWW